MSSSRSISSLRRLAGLEPWERLALVRAAALLAVAVPALRLLGFARTQRLFEGTLPMAKERPDAEIPALVERLSRLVDIAASHGLVSATCLPRSIVLKRLLGREGVPSGLRIGARRAIDGEFQAHAWVDLEPRPDTTFAPLE